MRLFVGKQEQAGLLAKRITKNDEEICGNKIKTALQKYGALLQIIPTRRYCGTRF